MITEKQVHQFWQANPCGEKLVGGIKTTYEEFLDRYDTFRYAEAPHIKNRLDEIDFKNKRVLEVGLGLGADSEQIIRRGAIWSGIDLTPESVKRVGTRFQVRNLPYERLEVGSVCKLPFADNSFDIVFSYGVLHHIPEINQAQAEIARVLKPSGQLIVMLYARYSLNYLLSIMLLRRLALLSLYISGIKPGGIVGQHLENARKIGLFNYLRMGNFVHRNTDGPLNPYSKVYSVAEIRKDFPDFRILKSKREFMWAPPLPVSWLPLASVMGWHIWAYMEPVKKDAK